MPYNPPPHIVKIADLFSGEAIAHFERTDGTIVIVLRDGRKMTLAPGASAGVYTPPAPGRRAGGSGRRRRGSLTAAPAQAQERTKAQMTPLDALNAMIEALKAFGLKGLLAALGILVIVFIARKSGLIVTGDQARIANVVVAAILAALSGDPAAETALLTVLTSVLASVIYELLKLVTPKTLTAYPASYSQRG